MLSCCCCEVQNTGRVRICLGLKSDSLDCALIFSLFRSICSSCSWQDCELVSCCAAVQYVRYQSCLLAASSLASAMQMVHCESEEEPQCQTSRSACTGCAYLGMFDQPCSLDRLYDSLLQSLSNLLHLSKVCLFYLELITILELDHFSSNRKQAVSCNVTQQKYRFNKLLVAFWQYETD